MIPEPGTAAASGQFPGGLLLYGISSKTTDNQPLDLVVHTAKGTIAKLRLPPVPNLSGDGPRLAEPREPPAQRAERRQPVLVEHAVGVVGAARARAPRADSAARSAADCA